jgi:hypothetical protein
VPVRIARKLKLTGRAPVREPARWPCSGSPWDLHRPSCVQAECHCVSSFVTRRVRARALYHRSYQPGTQAASPPRGSPPAGVMREPPPCEPSVKIPRGRMAPPKGFTCRLAARVAAKDDPRASGRLRGGAARGASTRAGGPDAQECRCAPGVKSGSMSRYATFLSRCALPRDRSATLASGSS